MKRLFLLRSILFIVLIASGIAWGADYPSKTINIICSYGVGGSLDTHARALIPYLGEELHVTVKVDNVVGANGVLGFNKAFNAAPDGYTLLTALTPYLQTTEMFSESSRYHAAEFIPLYAHARDAVVLVVNPEVFQKFDELVKAARTRTLSIGFTGIGSPGNIGALIVEKLLGAKITKIPFDGGAQATTTLAGKHIDAVSTYVTSALPLIRAGKIKPLVMLASERNPLYPDIPIPKDYGYNIQPLYGVFGMFAPPKTPPEKAKILESAFEQAVKNPKYIEWGKKMDADLIQVNAKAFKVEMEEQAKLIDAYKGFFK